MPVWLELLLSLSVKINVLRQKLQGEMFGKKQFTGEDGKIMDYELLFGI